MPVEQGAEKTGRKHKNAQAQRLLRIMQPVLPERSFQLLGASISGDNLDGHCSHTAKKRSDRKTDCRAVDPGGKLILLNEEKLYKTAKTCNSKFDDSNNKIEKKRKITAACNNGNLVDVIFLVSAGIAMNCLHHLTQLLVYFCMTVKLQTTCAKLLKAYYEKGNGKLGRRKDIDLSVSIGKRTMDF